MIFSEKQKSACTISKLQEMLDKEKKQQASTGANADEGCGCKSASDKLAWVTKQTDHSKVGVKSGGCDDAKLNFKKK